ncbi:MAG: hypothetical protein JEZ11_11450 [Desulfobacterales bacterium]|nr:hypothetical protein [Desulfobacterales bacterium]
MRRNAYRMAWPINPYLPYIVCARKSDSIELRPGRCRCKLNEGIEDPKMRVRYSKLADADLKEAVETMERAAEAKKGAKVIRLRKKNEPTVWFESMESLGQVLSGQNRILLRLIRDSSPHSLTELEKTSGRKKSNLSRTLKTLSNYGIVDLIREKGTVRPVVKATEFKVELSL